MTDNLGSNKGDQMPIGVIGAQQSSATQPTGAGRTTTRSAASRAYGQGAHFSGAPEGKGAKPGKGRKVPKPLIIVLVALVAIYGIGVAVWSGVFMPNTKVNGVDVSLKSTAALAEENANRMKTYSLDVTGENVNATIKASDVDLTVNYGDYAREAMSKVSPWAWPVTIFTGSNVEIEAPASYNSEKLAKVVQAAVEPHNKTATKSENATVAFDEASSAFEVKKEVLGTALDEKRVEQLVVESLSANAATLTLTDDAVQKPQITSDNPKLAQAAKDANAYLAATQTLTANNQTVMTLGAADIAPWVKVADDLTVSLDSSQLTGWVESNLAPRLETVGTTRTYQRADGKQVSVQGGNYGWSVDSDALAETLGRNVSSKTAATVAVPWLNEGAAWAPGGADWGARYIDCDLTEQHARMYDASGALIWESDFVSGDESEGRGTPVGVYAINSNKGTNKTLKGLDENHDGEPDYISEVDYWMPFYENLVAFHDADWRYSFGGEIYLTNGSHGCVNLPPAAAAELFQITQVGDPVVVHL